MPSYKKTSMRFIRNFFKGEKELLKSADVLRFNVPPFEEFSVRSIFEQVREDEDLMRHINYYEDIKELPERDYLFAVIGTLYPDYLQNLIQDANNSRNRGNVEESKD